MSQYLLSLLKIYHKGGKMTKYEWILENCKYSKIYELYECNEFLEITGEYCGEIFKIRVYGDNQLDYKLVNKKG